MDHKSWIELAATACQHAGFEFRSIETIVTWDQVFCSNAVYHINGQVYLKIFGPSAERQFQVERSVLRTLMDQETINAPGIVAEGQPAGGQPYLILTEIPGKTAEDQWESLLRSEQLAIARELGTITAAIHRLPKMDLAEVEQEFGGRNEHTQAELARRIVEIEAMESLPAQRRDDMIRFLMVEAQAHLNGPAKLAHCELAHNHIYLSQETKNVGLWRVSGVIDWADAMLGPPEWDVTFLWFWTFSRDQEAMGECLGKFYADSRPPDQLARRCLASILHTHSGPALLAEYTTVDRGSGSIVREMTEYLFPPEVFGPPG
jgi:hygromycin-B 7''-O-kinase